MASVYVRLAPEMHLRRLCAAENPGVLALHDYQTNTKLVRTTA